MKLKNSHQCILGAIILILISIPEIGRADFINGDFETGDMTGWTIAPGTNAEYEFDDVIMFDIDGAGPLPASQVMSLSVGQIANEENIYRHVDIVQDIQLETGNIYEFSFDWAVHNFFFLDNFDGGIFQLIVDDQVLATHDTQNVFTNSTERGSLSGSFVPNDSGLHTVGARISRRFRIPFPDASGPTLLQYLDNFATKTTSIPEPSGIGLVTLAVFFLRRRRK